MHGAPRILRGEALMIVVLTVLTVAEITRPPPLRP
ncbi:hypothetical protein J2853_001503 [Streptosporangium lutulentum]|uniref:Uncharacterized protein n=1 Tax=Streptosporangium lutulentum TaxID=1461250 RepID=A0ABT9Q6F5_9ACTN|nr:hypothetical protein [Streptosporangium lutulentum]